MERRDGGRGERRGNEGGKEDEMHREEKGREGKAREGKGRQGKGREGRGRELFQENKFCISYY